MKNLSFLFVVCIAMLFSCKKSEVPTPVMPESSYDIVVAKLEALQQAKDQNRQPLAKDTINAADWAFVNKTISDPTHTETTYRCDDSYLPFLFGSGGELTFNLNYLLVKASTYWAFFPPTNEYGIILFSAKYTENGQQKTKSALGLASKLAHPDDVASLTINNVKVDYGTHYFPDTYAIARCGVKHIADDFGPYYSNQGGKYNTPTTFGYTPGKGKNVKEVKPASNTEK